jgi:hypothetical protein
MGVGGIPQQVQQEAPELHALATADDLNRQTKGSLPMATDRNACVRIRTGSITVKPREIGDQTGGSAPAWASINSKSRSLAIEPARLRVSSWLESEPRHPHAIR